MAHRMFESLVSKLCLVSFETNIWAAFCFVSFWSFCQRSNRVCIFLLKSQSRVDSFIVFISILFKFGCELIACIAHMYETKKKKLNWMLEPVASGANEGMTLEWWVMIWHWNGFCSFYTSSSGHRTIWKVFLALFSKQNENNRRKCSSVWRKNYIFFCCSARLPINYFESFILCMSPMSVHQ